MALSTVLLSLGTQSSGETERRQASGTHASLPRPAWCLSFSGWAFHTHNRAHLCVQMPLQSLQESSHIVFVQFLHTSCVFPQGGGWSGPCANCFSGIEKTLVFAPKEFGLKSFWVVFLDVHTRLCYNTQSSPIYPLLSSAVRDLCWHRQKNVDLW